MIDTISAHYFGLIRTARELQKFLDEFDGLDEWIRTLPEIFQEILSSSYDIEDFARDDILNAISHLVARTNIDMLNGTQIDWLDKFFPQYDVGEWLGDTVSSLLYDEDGNLLDVSEIWFPTVIQVQLFITELLVKNEQAREQYWKIMAEAEPDEWSIQFTFDTNNRESSILEHNRQRLMGFTLFLTEILHEFIKLNSEVTTEEKNQLLDAHYAYRTRVFCNVIDNIYNNFCICK